MTFKYSDSDISVVVLIGPKMPALLTRTLKCPNLDSVLRLPFSNLQLVTSCFMKIAFSPNSFTILKPCSSFKSVSTTFAPHQYYLSIIIIKHLEQ